mgnify:CR=1 FL=1
MADSVFVAVTLIFFVFAGIYVRWCESLRDGE